MEKKNYFEPKEEVIFLQMNSALLSGSLDDGTDDDDDAGNIIPGSGDGGNMG